MENQTLIIALSMVAASCSAVLFLNWAGNRQIPGLLKIATGFLLTSIGVFLLATQGSAPPFVSIIAANLFLLGGRIPALIGFAEFWNQEKSRLPLICSIGFVLMMLGYSYFTFVDGSIIWRIRIFTVMSVGLSLSSIYIIANGLKLERKLRPASVTVPHTGAKLAILLFASNILVESFVINMRVGETLYTPNEATALMLLGAIVSIVAFSFAIVLMTMDELCLELKENAVYDPVTSVLNHRSFFEVGERLLESESRNKNWATLVTVEIENIEEIEGRHGPRVVNDLLLHFSKIAISRRRKQDVLTRSCLNVFRMLLPRVDEKLAAVVLRKVTEAITEEKYFYNEQQIEIEYRICAVTKQGEDLDLYQMIQESETLLEFQKATKTA